MSLPTPLQALHDGSPAEDKVASGSGDGASLPGADKAVADLSSLEAVRERSHAVWALGQTEQLEFWKVDSAKLDSVEDFVLGLLKRDYASISDIPPHSRLRHFQAGGVDRLGALRQKWQQDGVDAVEQVRRLVDVTVVSVLLDAGAGNTWRYTESSGFSIGRSEGLAVASLAAFEQGLFSSNLQNPHQVDAVGLGRINPERISTALQVSESNPMPGAQGRAELLVRLGLVLTNDERYFYAQEGTSSRPGHLFDYLLQPLGAATRRIALLNIWLALIDGLNPIWPASRTVLDGRSLGDVWECPSLRKHSSNPKRADAGLVPFHKLTQWLCYSLVEVIELLPDITVTQQDLQTGLPEYRNGGLLIDLGVLTPRKEAILASLKLPASTTELPALEAGHPAIVEMRALTVAALDLLHKGANKKLPQPLTLAQWLEAGTWKAGREIAKQKRQDGSPPIAIISDGTVF